MASPIRLRLPCGGIDYRALWLEASDRILSIGNLQEMALALADVVRQALGPVDVSAWMRLRNPNRLRLVAARTPRERVLPGEASNVVVEAFMDHRLPFRPEEIAPSAPNPEVSAFLEQTGAAVIVPLQSSGRLAGLLCVGSDSSGIPLGREAMDFLGVIGRHAAAEFHKAELLSELLRARESESFRIFATFLLHDLKNFASTLSLIARNAEKYCNDRDFQRDTFRSILHIAGKIKRMCNNLRAFSPSQPINARSGDLNQVVRETADNFRRELAGRLHLELAEMPAIYFDREEMARVVQNLVLNALEAIRPDGSVVLRTRLWDGDVELCVEDDGRGMDREFLEKDLFQPFRSTRSDGLGIGLFHCKRIIDAHGGSIAIESERGKGTIVRVRLPIRGVFES